jgi:Dolichyl-phosphate-mannose-protein mannosyltransferase
LPRSPGSVAAWAAIAAAAGFLLARIVPDVDGKPLFEDEAVSGLISARPAGELIVTTMWDRGGAPLHFLLTHLAFQLDASAEALRWVSVVFAVATVLVCYDLGHRLAGRVAGVGAAVVAATSGMLAVYGSFGRMYALLAFVSALAATLFVRALDERTARAALAAAAAAWLLPAVHPYGGIVVAVEGLIALAVWRGRPFRPALPVFAVALAMIPFAVADLRLADRFEVSGEAEGRLATWDEAWDQLGSAVGGFAGGEGLTLALFVGLALGGAVILLRRRPELVIWGLLALAAPPLLATLVRTGRAPDLSPRHLIFALPFFAACVGAAIARLPAAPIALAAVSAVAVFSAQGIVDPRSVTYTAALGSGEALAEPSAWLRERVGEDDVLYPYSSVFLAALPEAGEARTLPRGQAQSLLAAVERLDYPVGDMFVAVPAEGPLGAWTIVRAPGPFSDATGLLQRALGTLQAMRVTLPADAPEPLQGWFELNSAVLCDALSTLGSECVSE